MIGRRIPALAAAVLVVLCASCVKDFEGHSPGPTVAVIGDSTIGLAAEEIPPALADRYSQSLTFRSGKMTSELFPDAIDYAVNHPPDIAVVGLGTNDVGLVDVLWDLRGLEPLADQKEMLAILWQSECVVWVNVNEHIPDDDGRTMTAHARSFNAGLDHWARSDPRLHVVDWSSAVDADPELLLFDHVHPSERGQQVLASMIRTAVDDCSGADASEPGR